jgi:hypothetical protein
MPHTFVRVVTIGALPAFAESVAGAAAELDRLRVLRDACDALPESVAAEHEEWKRQNRPITISGWER